MSPIKKEHPRPKISLVYNHFVERQPDTIHRAGKTFYDYVEASPKNIERERLDEFFVEWFVYDFCLKTNRTPLETYLFRSPAEATEHDLDLLQQAFDSNYLARFWTEEIHREYDAITLRECATGKKRHICAVSSSSEMRGGIGLTAARLIQLNGDWYFALRPVSSNPVKQTEDIEQRMAEAIALTELRAMQRSKTIKEKLSYIYLDTVRMHFGPEGEHYEEIEVARLGLL